MKKVPLWFFALPTLMIMFSVAFAFDGQETTETATFVEENVTVEEITTEMVQAVKRANLKPKKATEVETTTEPETETASTAETETTAVTVPIKVVPLYAYKGAEHLDEGVQGYLYELWTMMGLPEDWHIYMVGLIYQECSFNIGSVHTNADGSQDIGYFQYNTKWFSGSAAKYGNPGLSIHNPYDQVWLFCQQMYARYHRGLSMEECISCHRRGDYDGYDAEYVTLVKQRTQALVRVN